jgi:hypothetical protein
MHRRVSAPQHVSVFLNGSGTAVPFNIDDGLAGQRLGIARLRGERGHLLQRRITACVLWGVVELDPPQDPSGFGGREGLIQGAHDGPLGIGRLGIEIKHVLHPGDVFAIDMRNAPHVFAPGPEVILGQAPPNRLARQALVFGEFDHRTRQQL